MYNRHFGLSTVPFRITPDIRRFFGGGQRAEILDTVKYAITHGEGMVKVTGEVGTGKTMLCRMLQECLPDAVEVVYLANPSLDRNEILAAIALELGLPLPEQASHLQLQQLLQHRLLEAHQGGRQVVVFIEEAQRMPLETLEEIRLLSNLETGHAKLLQLVLFGQPELDRLLGGYDIRQLRDRIAHSFELAPLSGAEVRDYVRFRLHSAGYGGNDLFTAAAYRQLACSSRGLIRRIHVLAEKSLLAAFAAGSARVGWLHVWRARSDESLRTRAWRGAPAGWIAGTLAGALLTLTGVQLAALHPPESAHSGQPSRAAAPRIDESLRQAALSVRPAAGMPLVSRRLAASREWLGKAPRKQLTVQLLLTDNDDLQVLERLLSSPPYAAIRDQIYLYRSEVSGRQRWSLLYGEYQNKTEARAALAGLPLSIQRHQPYLRSLALLRSAHQSVATTRNEETQG